MPVLVGALHAYLYLYIVPFTCGLHLIDLLEFRIAKNDYGKNCNAGITGILSYLAEVLYLSLLSFVQINESDPAMTSHLHTPRFIVFHFGYGSGTCDRAVTQRLLCEKRKERDS